MKATSSSMFKGISLIEGEGENRLISSREMVIDRLLESIGDRFRDVSTGVLMATKLTNFNNWPESREDVAGLFSDQAQCTGQN